MMYIGKTATGYLRGPTSRGFGLRSTALAMSVLLMWANAAMTAEEQPPTPPPAERQPVTIRLDPANVNILKARDAELRGSLCQFPSFPRPGKKVEKDRTKWKKYTEGGGMWVEVWEKPDDALIWTVDVPQAGYHNIYMLGTGRESVIEASSGDSKTTGWVNNGWDLFSDPNHYPPEERYGKWRAEFKPPDDYTRLIWANWDKIPLGSLYLNAGTNTITIRAPKPGPDLALSSLEVVRSDVEVTLKEKVEKLRSSTKWFADAKYGVFFHWTSSASTDTNDAWRATWPRSGERKVFPANVEALNVDAFVDMVRETGAGYVILTATWAEHCFPAPIKAIDDVLPGRTSKRDLVMELADSLAKHGIKLMLYYHPGQGSDPQWTEKTKDGFIDKWCAIMNEVGLRYGNKLAGWWFDCGGTYYSKSAPFDRLAEAAKAGNSDRIIAYNNASFWPKVSDFQDYLTGEGPLFWVDQSLLRYAPKGGSGIFSGGRYAGLQASLCFTLDSEWIHGKPDAEIPPPLWKKELLIQQVKAAIERKCVPSIGFALYEDGTPLPQTLELMKALRVAIRGQ